DSTSLAAAASFASVPGAWHNRGCDLSFADGHVEYWRWYSSRKTSKSVTPATVRQELRNLRRLQEAIPKPEFAGPIPKPCGFMATEPNVALKEGDPAPPFKAVMQNGQAISLEDFKGRSVILYFYPRDDTPGRTKEAYGFRNGFAAFED